MRILIDATNIANKKTGAGLYSFFILKELSQIDKINEYTILVNNNLNKNHELFNLSYKFISQDIPAIGLKRDLILSWFLWKKRREFDLFFNFLPYLPIFFKLKNNLITIHDLWYLNCPELFNSWPQKMYFKFIIKFSIRHSQNIIAVSETTKKAIKDFFYPFVKNIAIAYPSIGFLKNSENSEIKSTKEKYFLFVGERRPHKNLGNLIKAFALFKKGDFDGFKLILVGADHDNYTKELVDLAKKQGIEQWLIIKEQVADEELLSIYKNAFALILVSLYEGFGMPILEAMNLGIPIITSNVSSMAEVGGEAVLRVDPLNYFDINEKMLNLVKNKELREDLSVQGKERAKNFSWRQSAEAILEVINNYDK